MGLPGLLRMPSQVTTDIEPPHPPCDSYVHALGSNAGFEGFVSQAAKPTGKEIKVHAFSVISQCREMVYQCCIIMCPRVVKWR